MENANLLRNSSTNLVVNLCDMSGFNEHHFEIILVNSNYSYHHRLRFQRPDELHEVEVRTVVTSKLRAVLLSVADVCKLFNFFWRS